MAPKKSKATKKVEEAEEASAPGPEVVKKKRGRPAGVGGTKKKKGKPEPSSSQSGDRSGEVSTTTAEEASGTEVVRKKRGRPAGGGGAKKRKTEYTSSQSVDKSEEVSPVSQSSENESQPNVWPVLINGNTVWVDLDDTLSTEVSPADLWLLYNSNYIVQVKEIQEKLAHQEKLLDLQIQEIHILKQELKDLKKW